MAAKAETAQEQFPVEVVATHPQPHLDEALAIALLVHHGNEIFPGIDEAAVEIWGTGGLADDGRSARQWLQEERVLPVGVGRGLFDEHQAGGREEGSSAQLVVNYLGLNVQEMGVLSRILGYVNQADSHGDPTQWGIAACMKTIGRARDSEESLFWALDALNAFLGNLNAPKEQERVFEPTVLNWLEAKFQSPEFPGLLERFQSYYERALDERHAHPQEIAPFVNFLTQFWGIEPVADWLVTWLQSHYHQQVRFQQARAELTENFEFQETIHTRDSNNLQLIAVHSDNPRISAAGRYEGYDVIIKRDSNGHTQVFTQSGLDLDLAKVVSRIRKRELKARGESLLSVDVLRTSGEKIASWYFHQEAGGIYNGSESADEVEPSQLSLREITGAIILGLSR